MRLLFLLTALLASGCAEPPAAASPPADSPAADSTADLARFFPEGTAGAFVGYDTATGVTTRYGPTDVRRTPASTFKIFNSLATLDTRAVPDEHDVFEWDGVERWVASWNESMDLEAAFQRSALWVYQGLARRMGRDTLQAMLDRETYGNATLGDSLEAAWLDGSLRISPEEQVAFIRRLRRGDTGFSDRAETIVRRIMIADSTGGAVLRGKTGWALRDGENLGWWIGWLERGGEAYVFATLVESDDPEFRMVGARKPTTEAMLTHLSVR